MFSGGGQMQCWGPHGLLKLSGVSLYLFIFAAHAPKFMAPPESRARLQSVSTSGLPPWAGRHFTEALEPSPGPLGSWRCASETLGLDDGHSGQADLQGAASLPLALPCQHLLIHPTGGVMRAERPPPHGGCRDPSTSDMKVEHSLSGHKQPVFCGDGNGRVLPSGSQLCSFSLRVEVKMTTGSVRCAQSSTCPPAGNRGVCSKLPWAHLLVDMPAGFPVQRELLGQEVVTFLLEHLTPLLLPCSPPPCPSSIKH